MLPTAVADECVTAAALAGDPLMRVPETNASPDYVLYMPELISHRLSPAPAPNARVTPVKPSPPADYSGLWPESLRITVCDDARPLALCQSVRANQVRANARFTPRASDRSRPRTRLCGRSFHPATCPARGQPDRRGHLPNRPQPRRANVVQHGRMFVFSTST